MRRLSLVVAASVALLLTGCGNGDDDAAPNDDTTVVPEDRSSDTEEEAANASLTGTRWELSDLSNGDVSADELADVTAFIVIEDGEISGSTGCNTFGGGAEVGAGEDTLAIGQVIATKRACSGSLGKIDSAMLSVLRGDVTVDISGDTLTITNDDGKSLELRAVADA